MGCAISKKKKINLNKQSNITINIDYKEIILNSEETDKEKKVNGFDNLGNTCYINSIMQCLMRIKPLCYYFLNDIHLVETNDKNNLTISNYFGEMIKIYYDNYKKVIKYYDFYDYLLEKYNNVNLNEQEDAHEFMVFLLDSIHEDLNRSKNNKNKLTKLESFYIKKNEKNEMLKLETNAKYHWKNYLMSNKSIIIDLFQGQTKDTIKCDKCKITKVKFESIMYFSLPINEKNKSAKLIDCFKNYSEKEVLDKENKFFCENCKKKRKSYKQTDIWKYPPILIVHFKRFKYTEYGSKKLNNLIDFPINNFKLKTISNEKNKPTYDLFAVLNHKGSLESGHYYSYGYEKSKDKWYNFNDSDFSEINKENVITNSAYILFYYKNTIKSVKRQTLTFPQNWPFSNRSINFKKTIIENYSKKLYLENNIENEENENHN